MTASSSKHTACHRAHSGSGLDVLSIAGAYTVWLITQSLQTNPDISVNTILEDNLDHTAEMTSNIFSFFFATISFQEATSHFGQPQLCCLFEVVHECEVWNVSAQRSPNKVGGFPLGAESRAARQTLCGSFGLPGCSLVCIAQTGPTASFYLLSLCYHCPFFFFSVEQKKPGMKTWPRVCAHTVPVDINHRFMGVPVRVYKACALLTFLFSPRPQNNI